MSVWGGSCLLYVLGGRGQGTLVGTNGKITFHHVLLAMPWLRQLVTGLSSQRSGYDPLPVHVAFRVDELVLGKVFCRVVEFIPH